MIRSKKKPFCYSLLLFIFGREEEKKYVINIEYLLFIIYFVVIRLVDNVFNKVTGHLHQSLTLIK